MSSWSGPRPAAPKERLKREVLLCWQKMIKFLEAIPAKQFRTCNLLLPQNETNETMDKPFSKMSGPPRPSAGAVARPHYRSAEGVRNFELNLPFLTSSLLAILKDLNAVPAKIQSSQQQSQGIGKCQLQPPPQQLTLPHLQMAWRKGHKEGGRPRGQPHQLQGEGSTPQREEDDPSPPPLPPPPSSFRSHERRRSRASRRKPSEQQKRQGRRRARARRPTRRARERTTTKMMTPMKTTETTRRPPRPEANRDCARE
jgi:hypothetical protein